MSDQKIQVMAVCGNTAADSATARIWEAACVELELAGALVDRLDLAQESLPLFNPKTFSSSGYFPDLRKRMLAADVLLLATPDYHGCLSSALKNFLDHFWKEYAGKLIGSLVASYDKGLTVHDQIRTLARQCYAWTLPYGVSFSEGTDLDTEGGPGEQLKGRLEMLARDLVVYGGLLGRQRQDDLNGTGPGFLAHYRDGK